MYRIHCLILLTSVVKFQCVVIFLLLLSLTWQIETFKPPDAKALEYKDLYDGVFLNDVMQQMWVLCFCFYLFQHDTDTDNDPVSEICSTKSLWSLFNFYVILNLMPLTDSDKLVWSNVMHGNNGSTDYIVTYWLRIILTTHTWVVIMYSKSFIY